MRNFLWAVVILDGVFLFVISSLKLSEYELSDAAAREQFGHKADPSARLRRQLHKYLPQIKRLQQLELLLAGSGLVALLTHLTRPILGFLYALLALLLITIISRFEATQKLARLPFEKSLPSIIKAAKALWPLWRLVGLPERPTEQLPGSKAELLYQLQRLPSTVLEPVQRQRLEDSLLANEKLVHEIMTPKRQVISLSPTTTLGPIVLDDLSKTGHGLFPVVNKAEEVVGVLDIAQVGDINTAKTRQTVREQMSQQVFSIEHSANLLEASQVFLNAKQYLLVVEKDGNFAGIITIADLLRSLAGIVKESE